MYLISNQPIGCILFIRNKVMKGAGTQSQRTLKTKHMKSRVYKILCKNDNVWELHMPSLPQESSNIWLYIWSMSNNRQGLWMDPLENPKDTARNILSG